MAVTEGGHELSGWWRRAGAVIVDGSITGAVTLGLVAAAGFDFERYAGREVNLLFTTNSMEITFLLVQAVVSLLYYTPLMLRWDGRTIGKWAVGIRVVAADGKPLGAQTIVLRQVVMQDLLWAFVPLYPPVDVLWALYDRSHRTLHDLVAGTLVVRTPAMAPAGVLAALVAMVLGAGAVSVAVVSRPAITDLADRRSPRSLRAGECLALRGAAVPCTSPSVRHEVVAKAGPGGRCARGDRIAKSTLLSVHDADVLARTEIERWCFVSRVAAP